MFLSLFQFARSMNVSVFAKLSYDAIEERLSIDEMVNVEMDGKFYKYIMIFREVTSIYKMWKLDKLATRKCRYIVSKKPR